jgi:hypothetical protein
VQGQEEICGEAWLDGLTEDGLTPAPARATRAVCARLTEATREAAAKAAGVSTVTLNRWHLLIGGVRRSDLPEVTDSERPLCDPMPNRRSADA